MTPPPVSPDQEKARLQREAFAAGAEAFTNTGGFHVEEFRRRVAQSALCRYPDPPVLEPREEPFQGEVYRWAKGRLWMRAACGWTEASRAITEELMVFANDMRAYPDRDTVSGRACRQTPEGKVEYRDE